MLTDVEIIKQTPKEYFLQLTQITTNVKLRNKVSNNTA
jgi:hypothetical protein